MTQSGTGVRWQTTSRATGTFLVPAIPPGVFRVEVHHPGFRSALVDGIRLEPGDAARVDVGLVIGDVADVVRISAAPTILSGAVPQAVETRFGPDETARLPANGRDYLSLLLAAPGVTATNPQSFTVGQRMTSGGRPYLNGNRKETTSFTLEGVDINQHTDNLVSYLPSPDALESVAVTMGAASAEWGNYLGGVVTTRLKSGTNDWHGSAFGFMRDEALNATNWAAKWQPEDPLNPSRKTPLSHWTTGGTFGGPIARDRLFVFADYQAVRRDTGPSNGLVTVATDAMRAGDFSYLLEGASAAAVRPADHAPGPAESGPLSPRPVSRQPHPACAVQSCRGRAVPAPALSETRLSGAGRERRREVRIDLRRPSGRCEDRHAPGIAPHAERTRERQLAAHGRRGLAGHLLRRVDRLAHVVDRRAALHPGPVLLGQRALVGVSDIDLHTSSDNDGAAVGAMAEAIGIAGANLRRDGLPSLQLGGAISNVGNGGVVQRTDAWTLQLQYTLTWSLHRHTLKAGGRVLVLRQDSYFSATTGRWARSSSTANTRGT